ncbi:MAG: hypothetical protein ABEK50_15840 [bacterium]
MVVVFGLSELEPPSFPVDFRSIVPGVREKRREYINVGKKLVRKNLMLPDDKSEVDQ